MIRFFRCFALGLFLLLGTDFLEAQYSGTHTIGSTGDFTTIAAAFDSLEQYGVNGPVVLELIDTAYAAGAGRISYIPGSSDLQTVTLRPAAGVFPHISATILSGDSAAFLFRGAQYVMIDGSNSGSDSRDLTMTVTSSLGSFNALYIMGSRYITIKNCNIDMPQTGTSVSTGAVRLYYNTGNATSLSSNVLVENNRMMGGGACVYSFGSSSLGNHGDIFIINNEMGGSAPGDSIQNGIYTAYNTNIQVIGNRISVHNRAATVRGMYLGSGTEGAIVEANEVGITVDHATTNTYGIYATGTSPRNSMKIFNNWIRGVRNRTTATGTGGHDYGIRVEGNSAGTTDTVAFNSIYMDATSSKNSNAFGLYANNASGEGGTLVMNNIVHMRGVRGSTGSVVGIARQSAFGGLSSDYNDIYLEDPGVGSRQMVGAYLTTGGAISSPFYTLADWQTATGSDAHSFSVRPYYASLEENGEDLHLTDSTSLQSSEILNAGLWLGETYAYDKDDVTRNPAPDMGSLEFSGVNAPPGVFHLLTPVNGQRWVTNPAGYQSVTFSWTSSIDPEGDEIQYYFEADTSLSFTMGFGQYEPDTGFTIQESDLDGLAGDLGVPQGDSIVLYWRVTAHDLGSATTSLDTFSLTIVREVTAGVFYAELDGDHEVPPNYPYGHASGTFALNADSTALHYFIQITETAGEITAAHFHHALPGVNGPSVRTMDFVNEVAGGTWTTTDLEPLTPALVEALLGGALYVNVHTDSYPSGSIRGQVVVNPFWSLPEPRSLSATSGDGYVHLDWLNPDSGAIQKRPFTHEFLDRSTSVAGDGPTLTGYNVYRAPNDTVWILLAHVDTTSGYSDSSVSVGNPYSYFVTAIYDIGQSYRTEVVNISPVVGVDESGRPLSFRLYQNHPNPFNPVSTIRFDLAEPGFTRLTIFNALGQEVQTLVNRRLPAGAHEARWNGRDRSGRRVSSGLYFYRLESSSRESVRKMMLMK